MEPTPWVRITVREPAEGRGLFLGVYCFMARRRGEDSSRMPRGKPRMWEAGIVWEVIVQRFVDIVEVMWGI